MPEQNRPRVLFVDDELRILRSLALQFRRDYEVLTESDPHAALERLRRQPVDVLVSDQRMPGMSGAELLGQARQIAPDAVRILLTGYSDLDAAVRALNEGEIFHYLTKPWDPQGMEIVLRQAVQIAGQQRATEDSEAVLEPDPQEGRAHVLLLDADPLTQASVSAFCSEGGHRLHHAADLEEAVQVLQREPVDILVSDLRLANRPTAPLLKSLAQARPRLLTIVTTPFQDTQALLALINQAQIFRYVLKPLSQKLFLRALHAAAERAGRWRVEPQAALARIAEAPPDENEKSTVNGIVSMLGRLRGRFGARA